MINKQSITDTQENYSFTSTENQLKEFDVYSDKSFDFIIDLISTFKNFQNYENSLSLDGSEDSVRVSLYKRFIKHLYLEKIDVLKLIEKTLLTHNPNNLNHITVSSVNDLILFCKTFLDIKNKDTNKVNLINDELFSFFIEKFKNSNFAFDINLQIDLYFELLNISDKKNIDKVVFFENLEQFSITKNYDDDIIDSMHLLKYSSQKKIFNFINEHFPEELDNYTKYYKPLIAKNIFSQEDTFQSSLSINLIKLYDSQNIPKNKENKTQLILHKAFLMVKEPSYLALLNPEIEILHADVKQDTSKITFLFSSNSQEQLSEFKKILINSIRGLLNVIDTAYYITDDFDEVNTNLTPDFILKNYLFEDLNEQFSKPKDNKSKVKI